MAGTNGEVSKMLSRLPLAGAVPERRVEELAVIADSQKKSAPSGDAR
jgi:hypothetical protein